MIPLLPPTPHHRPIANRRTTVSDGIEAPQRVPEVLRTKQPTHQARLLVRASLANALSAVGHHAEALGEYNNEVVDLYKVVEQVSMATPLESDRSSEFISETSAQVVDWRPDSREARYAWRNITWKLTD
jgi:hypothetical protein